MPRFTHIRLPNYPTIGLYFRFTITIATFAAHLKAIVCSGTKN